MPVGCDSSSITSSVFNFSENIDIASAETNGEGGGGGGRGGGGGDIVNMSEFHATHGFQLNDY